MNMLPKAAALEKGVQKVGRPKAHVTSYGAEISLDATLDTIGEDESFVVDTDKMRKYALLRGRDKGLKLTSEKQENRFRIWRCK